MSYIKLLATIPLAKEKDGECQTCLENGFCRERADVLVEDVVYALEQQGVFAESVAVLQWLLDEDEIGMMKDENVEALAERWIEEKVA